MPQKNRFRPVPHALCERARKQWNAVESARDPAEQLKALFLAHCEAKDAEEIVEANQEATHAQAS